MKNEADRSAINKDAAERKSELANDGRKVGRKWRVWGLQRERRERGKRRERALSFLSPKAPRQGRTAVSSARINHAGFAKPTGQFFNLHRKTRIISRITFDTGKSCELLRTVFSVIARSLMQYMYAKKVCHVCWVRDWVENEKSIHI